MQSTTNRLIGNHALLKQLNRSHVLNLLRRQNGLSRKELTRLTQLDGKTITNVTKDLLRLGMIKSVGKLSRGVGRPSEILELNPQYGFAIGVDLGASHIAGIAVDFTGTILSRSQSAIHYGMAPSTVIKRMISIGEMILEKVKANRKKLLGVGVCVPGAVNREEGIGVWAANLSKWENVPLRYPFEKAFGSPVFFDESTRCAALGEMFARVHDELNDFLLLDLSLGIGAAIVQNGRLYYGHMGIAGEIGHTTVNPGGMVCRCGKQGCLEAEASGFAIAKKYSDLLRKRKISSTTMKKGKHSVAVSARDVLDRIAQGDEDCKNPLFGCGADAGRRRGERCHDSESCFANPDGGIDTGR